MRTSIANGNVIVSGPLGTAYVPLRPFAEDLARMGAIEPLDLNELEALSVLGSGEDAEVASDWEISGWLRDKVRGASRKLKKLARKAKPVVRLAKKAARSKVVKAAYQSAKQSTPMPYQAGLIAAESTYRFAELMRKKDPKALALAPSVRDAALGKISTNELKRRAQRIGVHPNVAVKAAAGARIAAAAARGDKKAAATHKLGRMFAKAKRGDKKAQARAMRTGAAINNRGKRRTLTVHSRRGTPYQAVVTPLD